MSLYITSLLLAFKVHEKIWLRMIPCLAEHVTYLLYFVSDYSELSREGIVGEDLKLVIELFFEGNSLLLFCEKLKVALCGERVHDFPHTLH